MRRPSKMPVRGGSRSRYSMANPYLTTPELTAVQMSISSWIGMWPTRVPATSWLRSGCMAADYAASRRRRSERAGHHQGVDRAERRMIERGRQAADDREAARLPQAHRARVRADHEVELHGAEAQCFGSLQ